MAGAGGNPGTGCWVNAEVVGEVGNMFVGGTGSFKVSRFSVRRTD